MFVRKANIQEFLRKSLCKAWYKDTIFFFFSTRSAVTKHELSHRHKTLALYKSVLIRILLIQEDCLLGLQGEILWIAFVNEIC